MLVKQQGYNRFFSSPSYLHTIIETILKRYNHLKNSIKTIPPDRRLGLPRHKHEYSGKWRNYLTKKDTFKLLGITSFENTVVLHNSYNKTCIQGLYESTCIDITSLTLFARLTRNLLFGETAERI